MCIKQKARNQILKQQYEMKRLEVTSSIPSIASQSPRSHSNDLQNVFGETKGFVSAQITTQIAQPEKNTMGTENIKETNQNKASSGTNFVGTKGVKGARTATKRVKGTKGTKGAKGSEGAIRRMLVDGEGSQRVEMSEDEKNYIEDSIEIDDEEDGSIEQMFENNNIVTQVTQTTQGSKKSRKLMKMILKIHYIYQMDQKVGLMEYSWVNGMLCALHHSTAYASVGLLVKGFIIPLGLDYV